MRLRLSILLVGLALSSPTLAADLPQGYLAWSRGDGLDQTTRKIFRMTLPAMDDPHALTSGEDVEPRISPDGKWVAYAKAKFPGGSDYHNFQLWRPYIVSIHGVGPGRTEIKIDDDGAWPSWGSSGALFYDQASGTHTQVVRVELDDQGRVVGKQTWVSTSAMYSQFLELNECFVAPDERWFAGRTRGNSAQNGVFAFLPATPGSFLIARAGDMGCMPFVAPDGGFAVIAGARQGIRWGHNPFVANRLEDQLLIAPLTLDHFAYHPAISTDGKWALAAQGTETDHNAGRYDLYIHTLDTTTMTAGPGQALTVDGFNGWPHLWVGMTGPPPPPVPKVSDFHASTYTISPGATATLAWNTSGADLVTLNGAPVLASDSLDVPLVETTTYTLIAASSVVTSSDTRILTVAVNPTPLPVSIDLFAASASKVVKGSSTVLSWAVSNATTLVLDGTPVGPTGSIEVTPLATTTYTLTAQGQIGPASAQVTVAVEAMSTGLLPDRGGFACALCRPPGRTVRAGFLCLGLLFAVVAVLRRRARRSR